MWINLSIIVLCFYRLLQQFSFEQQKTKVGELVNFACTLLSRHGPSRSGSEFAQLLIIVSDGRGVFNDGEAKVAAAIRRAKHQGVFMVFIVIDNPTSKVYSLLIYSFFHVMLSENSDNLL